MNCDERIRTSTLFWEPLAGDCPRDEPHRWIRQTGQTGKYPVWLIQQDGLGTKPEKETGTAGTVDPRGQKLNTNLFVSSFSGAAGISRQNPGISRQKSLISLVSRDIPNFWPPPPLLVEDPHPSQGYLDQKIWVWVPLSFGVATRWKKTFFCANFGRWKTFKIWWKVPGEKFLGGLRGAKNFSNAFRIVFRIFFRVFQTAFRVKLKIFRGQFRSAGVPP